MKKIIDSLKFDRQDLIPTIIQDYKTNEILMVAYMNKESLEKTLKNKKTYFWSRSRRKLWLKGETSGHIQKVRQVLVDCDKDALVFKVGQIGGACHSGYRSCFYRKIDLKNKKMVTIGKKVFDEKKIYKNK
jgi:phosphoribosyl-AMP cyclohydrolase